MAINQSFWRGNDGNWVPAEAAQAAKGLQRGVAYLAVGHLWQKKEQGICEQLKELGGCQWMG